MVTRYHGTEQIRVQQMDLTGLDVYLKRIGAICQQEDNIHKYTAELGTLYRTRLQPLDIKYNVSESHLNLEVVAAAIKNKANDKTAVHRVLGSVMTSRTKAESETKVNVAELLMCTWHLANNRLAPENSIELVIFNLEHNILAGGGCLAGIAARLIQPYGNLLKWVLDARYEIENKPVQTVLVPIYQRVAKQMVMGDIPEPRVAKNLEMLAAKESAEIGEEEQTATAEVAEDNSQNPQVLGKPKILL